MSKEIVKRIEKLEQTMSILIKVLNGLRKRVDAYYAVIEDPYSKPQE